MSTSNPPTIPPQPIFCRADFLIGVAAGVALSIAGALTLLVLAALIKKPLPVTVAFREAALQQGLVAVVSNTSPEQLKVAYTIEGTGTGGTKQGELFLNPGGAGEIGWMQGWRFVPGEKITLRNNRYLPATFIVPKP